MDKPRVLLVDDDKDCRELLYEFLLPGGRYDLALAEDGNAALRLYLAAREANRPFAALVLDLMMPGISGLEVARQIRQRYDDSQTVLFLLTGYHRGEIDANAIALDWIGYKPEGLLELETRLARNIQSRAMPRTIWSAVA